ncbi:GerAB/ArcD/ProY family transporter [Fictibacillus iocasae]|uniref:GerAB/ArcD/ProY family transporter n=1 Tax=Fictibacillus iocasae TaxID=2715437 RepID=A0ABW2NLR0_9BACL
MIKTITGFQLYTTMVMFLLGSAILINPASDAGKDAWLSFLAGTTTGLLLFLLYSKLFARSSNMPLTSLFSLYWGNALGSFLTVIYVGYFVYMAARVLRDFEELLVISSYQQTSLLTVGSAMMIAIIYALYKGFPVLARMTEVFIFFIISTLILLTFLLFINGLPKMSNFSPFLENGLIPVFKGFFPQTLTIPFGELIAFTMLLPYVKTSDNIVKKGFYAILSGGFILAALSFLNTLVLGESIAHRSAFPLLTTVGYINIADFIQRLESLLIIIIVLLGFVKITIFIFCAVIGMRSLFTASSQNSLIYPVCVTVLWLSLLIAGNHSAHIEEGLEAAPYFLHLPFQFVIPLLLLLTILFKQKKADH